MNPSRLPVGNPSVQPAPVESFKFKARDARTSGSITVSSSRAEGVVADASYRPLQRPNRTRPLDQG